VVVVSSVSCIYGLGSPIDFKEMVLYLRVGEERDRNEILSKLVQLHYDRNDIDFHRSTFRVRGDVLDIFPANTDDYAYRVEFFGDEIDRITQIDPLTSRAVSSLSFIGVFPASHYVTPPDKVMEAIQRIEAELEEQVKYFKSEDKLLEAQRIRERTNYDIEMLRETGFCSGIENYSRHMEGRAAGTPPQTLLDYFGDEFLIIIDESHMTLPQLRAMYNGDQSRKTTLVDYGFRLPSAKDNRPLKFEEFEDKIDQILFVSATPGPYEQAHELLRAEQIIRPTGLLDPAIDVRPVAGQVDDLVGEINKETKKGNKVLVTTLTKKMAEDLTQYLKDAGIRVNYLHSDIDTLERTKIIRDMRLDVFDVLVGINLLREGLDIPEITLVAILDADKEGFLRSETSLIQTVGRAARNSEGHVIMYADTVTQSMKAAIDETNRRRAAQQAYNEAHGITPTTIRKKVRDLIAISKDIAKTEEKFEKDPESMSTAELNKLIKDIEKQMRKAAADLNFEAAAQLRDRMLELKKHV
jgi:excinuclease ABC subunit B